MMAWTVMPQAALEKAVALLAARFCGALPKLMSGPCGKMLAEAVGHLKKMPGAERLKAFRQFGAQITEATKGQWTAKELAGSNATIFTGEGGEALSSTPLVTCSADSSTTEPRLFFVKV
jgi:hypothetical protein